MKSVEDIRAVIEASGDQRVSGIFEVQDILLAMLDHIDTLNGRTDIMREVAEGGKVIVSADLIKRYQAVAIRIWEIFPSDPLGDSPAHFWIERLEAIVDKGLLVPSAPHACALPVDYTKPHKFDLQKETGLPHIEYQICKCGLSKGNVIHVE